MVATQRGLTLAEFLELPERKPALEFHPDGVVRQKVSPKGRHSVLQGEFVEYFNLAGKPRKIARAFPELRTTYAGASHVPDVSVYDWERIPRGPGGEVADEFLEPPDVAIEIVSPRQSLSKLRRRCQWYVDHGVPLALLVDPRDRSITLFRAGASPAKLRGADQVDFDAIIPGLRLVVEDLFEALML
jgi:Uma2 family endonuclease